MLCDAELIQCIIGEPTEEAGGIALLSQLYRVAFYQGFAGALRGVERQAMWQQGWRGAHKRYICNISSRNFGLALVLLYESRYFVQNRQAWIHIVDVRCRFSY